MGEDIRNEKVIPSGIPDSTKPIKTGTAEQEQNGVTMPNRAANTLPIMPRAFPSPRSFLVLSGGKKLLIMDTIKIITISIKKIFMES
jgi:hypothetical protein